MTTDKIKIYKLNQNDNDGISFSANNLEQLVVSRDRIVQKFNHLFTDEKSYDTINRYYNLLLVEYYEFLDALKDPDQTLSEALEELADVVLYQNSLVNELRYNLSIEENDSYFFKEELPAERAIEYSTKTLDNIPSSLAEVFTQYFMQIFGLLVKLYPDRKYHRGQNEEIDHQKDLERAVELIKTIEGVTTTMVFFNLLIIQNQVADTFQLGELIEEFDHIIVNKIDKVEKRLDTEYPTSNVVNTISIEKVDEEETALPTEPQEVRSIDEVEDLALNSMGYTKYIGRFQRDTIDDYSFDDYLEDNKDILGNDKLIFIPISDFEKDGDIYTITFLKSHVLEEKRTDNEN